jgi:hypothetical protein
MEEKMIKIMHNLKFSQDRKNIYVDNNNTYRDFKVGEHVFLKVKVKKSLLILGCCPMLAMRYYGPFEILKKIGPVSYMLELNASMRIHNVFHVSLLKKYVPKPNHVIVWTVI